MNAIYKVYNRIENKRKRRFHNMKHWNHIFWTTIAVKYTILPTNWLKISKMRQNRLKIVL